MQTVADENYPLIRRGPIVYDPEFDRYVVIGGYSNAGGLFPHDDALFLQPGATPTDWQWVEITPLPSTFDARHSHLLYYDPEQRSFATGLGYTQSQTRARDWWTYRNGQWAQYTIPDALRFRQGFGYAYDSARKQVVLWGDNDFPIFDEEVWFLSGTSTSAGSGWRSANLDAPVPRGWPTLVYDADREVTVAFGGLRFDERFVPPNVYSIISQPSWPYLNATIDLAAARPKGIARLHLDVRAAGDGDGDSTGPRIEPAGGVIIRLWDHTASAWYEAAQATNMPGEEPVLLPIDIVDQPERFVSPQGTVPISITSMHPATEAQEAQLRVDLLDGYLELRSGVTLP